MITTPPQETISPKASGINIYRPCKSCGSPISEIQEIMGNTLLSLFKNSFKIDMGSGFKIISCFKCLSREIKEDLNKFELQEMQRIIDLAESW